MRKKSLNGKRVMAFVLAFSLVLGEASAVVAAPADASATCATETVAEQAPEAKTAEEAVAPEAETAEEAVAPESVETEVQIPETEEAEDAAPEDGSAAETAEETSVSENDTEITVSENDADLDADEAYDGSISKVIGLEASGRDYDGSFKDDNGNVVYRYVAVRDATTCVEAPGKIDANAATGLYSYNGKLYRYASYDKYLNVTTFRSYNEIALLGNPKSAYLDAATRLYKVNGTYYSDLGTVNINGKECAYYNVKAENNMPMTGSFSDDTAGLQAFRKQYGRYTKSDAYYQKQGQNKYDVSPDYYAVGGKCYKNAGYHSVYEGGKRIKKYYGYTEIALNAQNVTFSWNTLHIKADQKNSAGQELLVGYEVEVNGALLNTEYNAHEKSGTPHRMSSYTGFTYDKYLTNGQSVRLRVRGLYYHQENKVITENGVQSGNTVNVIDAFGEWSEPYTYTYTAPQAVGAVPSVTARYIPVATEVSGSGYSTNKNKIRITYTTLANCEDYRIYRIASKKAISLTTANFSDVYYKDSATLQKLGLSTSDFAVNYFYSSDTGELELTTDKNYSYYYFAVVPSSLTDYEKYYNDQSLETIKAVAGVTAARNTQVLTPVTNLHVEKYSNNDGSYGTTGPRLVWDGTDKNVVVFAYEAASFPAYYTTKFQKPSSADGEMEYQLSDADRLALNKVKYTTESGSYNASMAMSDMNLVPGRTYYFVAYTYDKSLQTGDQTPITYKTTKKIKVNGVEKTTPVTYSYDSYIPISAPSNMVSYKYAKPDKPTVSTYATKNSVKLTVGGYNTGYEIYRKSGKKFKKIATMTDDVYKDTGLKNGVSYTYKVRGYYYNRDTKEKYYSDYRVVTVKAADAANISVSVTKASKSSAKIKWTKVPNAVKYEIYRSSSENTDPKTISKKFSASGRKDYLSDNRYELIKTLGKSKTSLTDKKLAAGQKYSYVVIAYYKAGGKTEYVSGGGSALMALDTTVKNIYGEVNGSNAKITWDKDTFAAKYELEYTMFDINGYAKNTTPLKASTKKNTYTIKGLGAGETVSVRIRAVGKGNVYGRWTSASNWSSSMNSLAPVKGIKASAVTKKTSDGKTVNGVKITWKAVKGAKYYKVYRSVYEGTYDKDKKLYYLPSGSLIKKDGNDDFYFTTSSLRTDGYRDSSSYESYEEYNGVTGSVVGTTAYDYEDVPAGVTYYYTVQAYGETPMAGTDSNVYSVMSSKAAKVTADGINTVTLKNSKKGKVTVTFNTVPGAKKYTVYRSMKKGGKYTKVATVKVTKKNKNKKSLSYTGKAVKKKTYYYKVVAEGTNELKADMKIESAVKKIKVKK